MSSRGQFCCSEWQLHAVISTSQWGTVGQITGTTALLSAACPACAGKENILWGWRRAWGLIWLTML